MQIRRPLLCYSTVRRLIMDTKDMQQCYFNSDLCSNHAGNSDPDDRSEKWVQL